MKFLRIAANLGVNLKEFIRNKAAIFWTQMFPILLILLFGFIFSGQEDVTYDLPVQDLDGRELSTNLTDILNETDLFNVIMVDPFHAKRIHDVLTHMIEEYEKQYGKIEKPKPIKTHEKKMKKKNKDSKKKSKKETMPSYFG